MSARSREIGTATLFGLIVGGLISVVLDMGQVPLSTAVGALVGGAVAAYVLYGKLGHAALAGALAGVLSTFFYLGVAQVLVIFEVIPIPPGPSPSMAELQPAVVLILGMDLVAGAAGGALGGAVHRPVQAPGIPTPLPSPPLGTGQAKYCVQCGAHLPAGTVICPHCSARQPQ
jgi:hypothetical protein